MTTQIYYHGTPEESRALLIIKEGIRPDLSKTKGLARPVGGRIYMGVNLKDAMPYLLGGAMAGHEIPAKWIENSRYGYLFLIRGSDLMDVQPDEDQVGQAIHDKELPWVDKYFNKLGEESCVEDEDPDDEPPYRNLLEQLNAGEYCAWIKAGHILLPYLSQQEKSDIIQKYGNIAHLGTVYPTEVWKFDKTNSPSLKEDCSNFFELAINVPI